MGSPGATGTAATLPDVCRPGIAKLRKSGFRNPRSTRSGLDALGLEVLGLDVSSLDVSSFEKSDFERSGFDTSGLGKPLALPDGSGFPPAPLGEPENSGLGRGVPALADPGSGGCGGKPAAIRWRAPGAVGRSRLVAGRAGSDSLGRTGGLPAALGAGCPVGLREPTGGGPDRSTIVAGSEGAVGARGRAGSRPLFPGGAFPEFTAYVPTLTPTMAATVETICSGTGPAPQGGAFLFRRAPISCRFPIEFPSGIEASNQPKIRCE